MSIDPSQVSVNLGSVYEWLKLIGYLGLGVTAIVKVSRFATKAHDEVHEFVTDVRDFLKESRAFMAGLKSFTTVVETNHLRHIEAAVLDIQKSLKNAPLARVVESEEEK
jgi:hypothetical protein